jgi:catechol 2,3-dioxygenase-like lactoylglutathione lyase family enzyme
LSASRAFYTYSLGWTPVLDLDEVIFYQVGRGLLLALFGLDDLGDDVGHTATPGTSFSLGQIVSEPADVDATLDRARRAGGVVLKEGQWAAWGGYHGYVADPDGHRWKIAHNPGWSVADDGTVTITAIEPRTES